MDNCYNKHQRSASCGRVEFTMNQSSINDPQSFIIPRRGRSKPSLTWTLVIGARLWSGRSPKSWRLEVYLGRRYTPVSTTQDPLKLTICSMPAVCVNFEPWLTVTSRAYLHIYLQAWSKASKLTSYR